MVDVSDVLKAVVLAPVLPVAGFVIWSDAWPWYFAVVTRVIEVAPSVVHPDVLTSKPGLVKRLLEVVSTLKIGAAWLFNTWNAVAELVKDWMLAVPTTERVWVGEEVPMPTEPLKYDLLVLGSKNIEAEVVALDPTTTISVELFE